MPLSTSLIISPRRVVGLHQRTRLGCTLCLSPPGSACLLGESRARTAGQGFGPRFAFLNQAHRLSSPSGRLAPRDKNWVHVLKLSTMLSVSHRRVVGMQPRTRLVSTLSLSPPGSNYLLAKSWARIAGLCFSLHFASHNQTQRVSSPSHGLAPLVKAFIHVLSLSTRHSVSPRLVAGSYRRTKHGSTLCLSHPSLALLIAMLLACTVGQGLSLRFASPPGSMCLLAESWARIAGQGLGPLLTFSI